MADATNTTTMKSLRRELRITLLMHEAVSVTIIWDIEERLRPAGVPSKYRQDDKFERTRGWVYDLSP